MPGEKEENQIVFLDTAVILDLSEGAEDARSLRQILRVFDELEDTLRIEPEVLLQNAGELGGVTAAVLQSRHFGVVVDADE